MKKRGQITAFILVGFLIVLLFGIGFYFKAEIKEKLSDVGVIEKTAVPPEVKNVNDFILQCLKETSSKGIELLGLQGGYIQLPEDKVPVGNINLFSNHLEVLPGFNTAYWYYQKDNLLQVKNIPSKENMEKELEAYIDQAVEECLNNFTTFPGYKINYRKIESKVIIEDNQVRVNLNMPMVIDIKGQKFNLNLFKTRVNVDLGNIIDLATKIVQKEIETNYLEQKTIDMMVAYKEIPYTGSELSCGVKTWVVRKIIEDFKNILSLNIPHIRIVNTDYELLNEDHKYFEWDVTTKTYDDMNVVLSYSPSWPFYLDVIKNEYHDDGEVIKSQQLVDNVGEVGFIAKRLFCMNFWNFVYDVKYPVLVTIYDSKNDYTFQFAIQVVIERNQPRKAEIVPDISPEKETKYCQNTKMFYSSVYTYEEDLDGASIPLDNVNIKYKCVTNLCNVGKTKLKDGVAVLETKFPSCIGGSVIAYKDGYHRVLEEDVDSNNGFSISLTLEKIIPKPVKVHVTRENGGSGEPTRDEQVIIELREEEKDYSTMILYPDQKEVNLIPGIYKVKEYIFKKGAPIKIPEKTIKDCVEVPKEGLISLFGGTEEKCTEVEIPEIELENMVTGGSEFEWEVTKKDLYLSDYVKFYISSKSTPSSLEELNQINLKQDVFLPEFLDE